METINKTEALNRLTSLENEAKKLRQIIDAPVNIIERAKSFEAACRESKRSRLEIDVINLIPDKVRKAQERIELFAEVLREGKDPSECFYYPYFKRSSGGGFSYGGSAYGYGYTGVGARLRVDTAEKALHLGKIMLEDYRIYLEGK